MDLMSTAQLLGNFGEFVGALAVIGSLVYLPVHIRHGTEQSKLNTKAVEATAYNQTVVEMHAWGRMVVSDPALAGFLWKAMRNPESIEGDDRIRFHGLMGNYLFAFENLFRLYEQGMIDQELWENSISNNRMIFYTPGVRAVAESRSSLSSLSKRFWAHAQMTLEHSDQ